MDKQASGLLSWCCPEVSEPPPVSGSSRMGKRTLCNRQRQTQRKIYATQHRLSRSVKDAKLISWEHDLAL